MALSRPKSIVLCELADTGIPGLESYSPFCLKVHRALRVAGLSYERRHGRAPREFKALNPAEQVPVLLIDDEAVSDSTRILARIDAMTGALTRGLDAKERAEAWLWEDFADTVLSSYVASARWADERNWPLVREAYFGGAPALVRRLIVPRIRAKVVQSMIGRDIWRAGASACWARFEATLDQLEWRAPDKGCWIGRTLSVADIAIYAQLRSLQTPLTGYQFDQLENRTRLRAYLDRVGAMTLPMQSPSTTAPSTTERAALLAS